MTALDRLRALHELLDNSRSVDERIDSARALGMSNAAIAAAMGVPESAVALRGTRAGAPPASSSGFAGAIMLLAFLWALSR